MIMWKLKLATKLLWNEVKELRFRSRIKRAWAKMSEVEELDRVKFASRVDK